VLAIRIIFLLGGAVLGTFYPFVSVIFAERGFGPAGIGLVTAAGSLAFAVSVPIWGHLADARLGRGGALRVAVLGSGLALLFFGGPWLAFVLVLMYLAFMATESAIGPLSDAIAVNALERPERQYPSIRLLSSLGFAAVAIGCGFLYDRSGYWPSTLLYAAVAVGLAAAAWFAPDRPRADLASYGDEHRRGGSFRIAFSVQPRLPGVLLAIFLVHVGVLGGFTFLSLRIVELGGSPSDVALSAGLSALAEVPGMLLAGWLVSRLGLRGLFVAGVLVYAACIASWAVLASPLLIVGTRLVTGFAFAAIWISSVLTMQRLLPPRLQGTSQGLYQTTAFGLAAVLANVTGGLIVGAAGSGTFFALAAVVTASAAFAGWAALPGRREARPTWPEDAVVDPAGGVRQGIEPAGDAAGVGPTG
jgi:PPP family 3-phenylpropionic acid transporter